VQTAQVINPGLKSLLLKNPSFIVDFQDKKFLIYREYTFEAEDYTTVLEMGQAILRNLNREIPAASKESQDAEVPIQFVSRSMVRIHLNGHAKKFTNKLVCKQLQLLCICLNCR